VPRAWTSAALRVTPGIELRTDIELLIAEPFATIHFTRFKCMFHLDVTKGSGVAYVEIATHICFKCMFHMFQLFQTYVANVYSKCFSCFQTYVASVSSGCCNAYTGMFQEYNVYVATFERMLQKR
jgi:hypothetical protein